MAETTPIDETPAETTNPATSVDNKPATRPLPGLPPLRFSLATMLLVVAGICVLLAAMTYVGPLGAFALLLAALVVLAHVAGNAIGTQLRDTGGRSLPDDLPRVRSMLARPEGDDFAPPTELRQSTDISATLYIGAGIGAALGTLGGGGLLAWVNWERLTLVNVASGAVAFGVIGGILGCWVASFVRIGWSAFRQSADSATKKS